jgi:hypothetical protein
MLADLTGGAHGFERARHDLRGARAMKVVGRLRLEQLGVRQDDAQLVVQAVEEEAQIGTNGHGSPRLPLFDDEPVGHQAGFRCSVCHASGAAGRSLRCGSRQSVSTKMRTEPPAVRTYSIFPDESQL